MLDPSSMHSYVPSLCFFENCNDVLVLIELQSKLLQSLAS